MSSVSSFVDESVFSEFRKAAEDLLPIILGEVQKTVSEFEKAAIEFAGEFGSATEFSNYFVLDLDERSRAERRLLSHFQNNVELLIQKTWVEKADESTKEKLLARIPVLVEDFSQGAYDKALKVFTHLVDELLYLLFGAQSRKADFLDYALRIDPRLGLFCWYGARLSTALGRMDADRLRALVLIGFYFLAIF